MARLTREAMARAPRRGSLPRVPRAATETSTDQVTSARSADQRRETPAATAWADQERTARPAGEQRETPLTESAPAETRRPATPDTVVPDNEPGKMRPGRRTEPPPPDAMTSVRIHRTLEAPLMAPKRRTQQAPPLRNALLPLADVGRIVTVPGKVPTPPDHGEVDWTTGKTALVGAAGAIGTTHPESSTGAAKRQSAAGGSFEPTPPLTEEEIEEARKKRRKAILAAKRRDYGM
jgi:hypothetical protein